MGDGRIFLKSRRDASFNEDLWNEPNLGWIHLASTFKFLSNENDAANSTCCTYPANISDDSLFCSSKTQSSCIQRRDPVPSFLYTVHIALSTIV